jgi:hypothetical protein
MTLDKFEVGNAWLERFPFIEREIGRQLLRSLRLVSHSQFETELSNALRQLFTRLKDENVALFSVIETPTEETEEDIEGPPKRVAGSSADRVKAMNENLARIYGPRIQAHPTVHSMRAQKMKNIVLVEDFIGTGRRLTTYLRKVMDPTLKSWISYKWTKLWIVAYGGLENGLQAILRTGYGLTGERIRLATTAQKPGQYFTPLMLSFCKKHAELTQRKSIPLGFGSGAVGMIFEHSCPNNAPVVLWSKGPKYKPLFPDRGIPIELKPAFLQEDVNRPSTMLWNMNQYRLALAMLHEPGLERRQGSQWRLLLMMGLASRSGWDDTAIAGVIGIPIAEVTQQRIAAYRLGALDMQTHLLTTFGRGLLDRVRETARRTPKKWNRSQRALTEIYYPLSCDKLVRH